MDALSSNHISIQTISNINDSIGKTKLLDICYGSIFSNYVNVFLSFHYPLSKNLPCLHTPRLSWNYKNYFSKSPVQQCPSKCNPGEAVSPDEATARNSKIAFKKIVIFSFSEKIFLDRGVCHFLFPTHSKEYGDYREDILTFFLSLVM